MALNKEEVIDYLSQLPVIELSELISNLEEKWGVKASAPVAVAAGGGALAGGATQEAEEKTEFSVTLASVGSSKINVIKEIRALTSLGLKEAKELVESAPKVVKEGLSKEDAEKIKAALTKVGATVQMK